MTERATDPRLTGCTDGGACAFMERHDAEIARRDAALEAIIHVVSNTCELDMEILRLACDGLGRTVEQEMATWPAKRGVVFVTRGQAILRWGAERIFAGEGTAVRTCREIVDGDGHWKPLFDDFRYLVGYSLEQRDGR